MGCSGVGASLFFVLVAASGDFGGDGNESSGNERWDSRKGRGEGQGIFCGEEQGRNQEDGGDEDALAALLCSGADAEGDGSAEAGDVTVPEVLHDLPGDLRKIVETEKGCGEKDDRGRCAHFFLLMLLPPSLRRFYCGLPLFSRCLSICSVAERDSVEKRVFFSEKPFHTGGFVLYLNLLK